MMSKKIKKYGILLLLFSVLVACNSKNKEDQSKEDHSKHNMSTEDHNKHDMQDMGNEPILYTCSMDPQIKEDKPGKCPICHMTLTPIKKNNGEANEIS